MLSVWVISVQQDES